MNKKEQISFWKQQLESASTMKSVARQTIQTATQIESAAQRALATLEAKSERTRKGFILAESMQIKLRASLTK